MEWWWDALKKVMRLYKQIHESDNPTDSPNEIDDYFLFIKQDDVEFDKKRKFTE
jgi:hypothetical protein